MKGSVAKVSQYLGQTLKKHELMQKKSNTKPNKTDNASNTKPTNPPPNNK